MHSSLSSQVDAPPDPFLLAADLLDPRADPDEADPVAFAQTVLGFHAWSKQRQIMESVRDHPRTSVRACHGVGKTATAAEVALWFLKVFRNSRVITTAPTWAQVEQLLWREIRASVGRAHAKGLGRIFPSPNATKLELGDQWFAIGLSTNEPERFQGHHADHLLLIVDEASGVDEQIFEAAEGFLTAEGAKVLLIGNPTKIGGTFYESFHKNADRWSRIHISAVDAPNETGERVPPDVARALPRKGWVQEKRDEWGEQSPMFQVRVLGEFSAVSDDTVIDLASVTAAQQRVINEDPDQHQVVIGCDVARFGSDETVITRRVGQHVDILETYVGKALTHTAERIVHHASQHSPHVRVVVDDPGVGGGVTDLVRASGLSVAAFNGGAAAHRPLQYPNRRSELWFQLAAQIDDLDLPDDDRLAADLTSAKYTLDDKLRRVVEKKADSKKRLKRSPDRADAVMLLLVAEQSPGAVVAPPRRLPGATQPERETLSDDDLLTMPM